MGEFVSCIMATRNREQFIGAALGYFDRQTYLDSELLIIDDSDKAVEHLCAGRNRVKYIRMSPHTPLGTKLNRGITSCNSKLLLKIDDDDYYDKHFIERAVAAIEGADIVAWDCFLVWIRARNELYHSGHGWAAGGTLLFRRAVWEKRLFRDVPAGVDFHFLRDHATARLRKVCEPEMYVHIRHEAHTWRWFGDTKVEDYFASGLKYSKTLSELLEPNDWAFYRSLRPTSGLFCRTYRWLSDRLLTRGTRSLVQLNLR